MILGWYFVSLFLLDSYSSDYQLQCSNDITRYFLQWKKINIELNYVWVFVGSALQHVSFVLSGYKLKKWPHGGTKGYKMHSNTFFVFLHQSGRPTLWLTFLSSIPTPSKATTKIKLHKDATAETWNLINLANQLSELELNKLSNCCDMDSQHNVQGIHKVKAHIQAGKCSWAPSDTLLLFPTCLW